MRRSGMGATLECVAPHTADFQMADTAVEEPLSAAGSVPHLRGPRRGGMKRHQARREYEAVHPADEFTREPESDSHGPLAGKASQ